MRRKQVGRLFQSFDDAEETGRYAENGGEEPKRGLDEEPQV